MGLNWVEDLVAHLYQLEGYMVMQNEDLIMPKTEHRSIRGHSDIDVIAIKQDSIVHAECQSWWGPAKADEPREFRRLADRFDNAPATILRKYDFLDADRFIFSRVFVTSGKPKRSTGRGPWDRLDAFCTARQIQLFEINTVIRRLARRLLAVYPGNGIVGKEPTLSRFLLHLIHAGFIDRNSIVPQTDPDTEPAPAADAAPPGMPRWKADQWPKNDQIASPGHRWAGPGGAM